MVKLLILGFVIGANNFAATLDVWVLSGAWRGWI